MSRILVIDDSALMRRLAAAMLREAGHEVDEWMPLSAVEIPERLQDQRPDLVLSDYQMPGLNGQTVAKMVQRSDPTIKVIILTSLRDPEVEAGLAKFGVSRVLHKPIEEKVLIAAVAELLGG